MNGPWHVVLDQPFRGDVERAYLDSLNQVRVCSAQCRGDLEVSLRGEAVLLASRRSTDAPLADWGSIPLDGLDAVIDDGTEVLVELESCRTLLGAAPLRAGVRLVTASDLARRWLDSSAVLFF
ncbi:hypothetical protein [Plantibacter sp. CFBP 8775]|uniref:hypothetical protein n=1 Tax=Plantibacter sp. CFBP 8775 TaxID=2774038 RepID=UPI001781FE08|nr:hypothetical protein [Plantibacter sp. CFBP 8775]MBD8104623.1 hypothetical protein [Plantibacter sp. CFBP 8775]